MNIRLFITLLCAAMCLWAPEVAAQDDDAFFSEKPIVKVKKKKVRKEKKTVAAVPKALRKLKRVSGKVNTKALLYVYLESASWCVPCKKIMPDVVRWYKEMRKDGRVEIVLIGRDHTPEAVAAYIKGYKCKMPAFFNGDKNINKLPGYSKSGGIPHATVVSADGTVVTSGYPTFILSSWAQMADKAEEDAKAEEEAKAAEENSEDASADEEDI